MSNSVDHDEPSYLDLRCLQKPIMPMAMKELTLKCKDDLHNMSRLVRETVLNVVCYSFAWRFNHCHSMCKFFFFFFFCMLKFINNILLVTNYFHRIRVLLEVNNLFLQKKKKKKSISFHSSMCTAFSLYLFLFLPTVHLLH